MSQEKEFFEGVNKLHVQDFLHTLSQKWETHMEKVDRDNRLYDNILDIKKLSSKSHSQHDLLDSIKTLQTRLLKEYPNIEKERPSLLEALMFEMQKVSSKIERHTRISRSNVYESLQASQVSKESIVKKSKIPKVAKIKEEHPYHKKLKKLEDFHTRLAKNPYADTEKLKRVHSKIKKLRKDFKGKH